ncbi:MAG: hypothetical protein WAN35_00185 [Terracidiphilus sp.]
MEHDLSISSSYIDPDGNEVRGVFTVVKAETNLGKVPLYPYPESFTGRLIGIHFEGKLIELTMEQLNHFRFGQDVRVEFIGKLYRFKQLDADRSFEMALAQIT